ncbi:MAG: ABC transporter ATP-binding protein [Deltaproteobacteria bacterium]|nr:MAG: ABC transporter ATP-binding protein [Deltaproteobacteria bacterium]
MTPDGVRLPLLAADRLRVERGGAALLDVPSLSVFEGETLAVIGANGAGKTTLLLALATVLKVSSGSVLFRGVPVGAVEAALPYRRRIAVAFQEPLLFDGTVAWNAAEGLRLRKVPSAEAARRAGEMLERFRIAHLAGRSARTLSGGEAQRVSLARAFAVDPEVVFLDEPFSGLDPESREEIVDDLETALRVSGTTAVFVTHDRVEALRLGDRIAVMHGGRIAQVGAPDEVMNRPANGVVASFVGIETVLDAIVAAADNGVFVARVVAPGASDAAPFVEAVGTCGVGDRVLLCIRPENVTLSRPGGSATSARNVFPGVVSKVTPQGAVQRVVVDCGVLLSALVTTHAAVELGLAPGCPVVASVKATAIHAIRR